MARTPGRVPVIGVLPGEGIGAEVVDATLRVLEAAAAKAGVRYDLRTGGPIGGAARRTCGKALSDEVAGFCEKVFADGGAVLCGPAGARFVYELRARFDLFCKLTPIWPMAALDDTGAVRRRARAGVDLVIARENAGGVYFGRWGTREEPDGTEAAFHAFEYRADEIARILDVGIALARSRRGRLCIAMKREGVPSISGLWDKVLEERTAGLGLETRVLDIDNAVFQIVADAASLDVLVAPNMLGDILADCAALLLSSRGMSFSGNFGRDGRAVYQTGHGAAYDLAGAGTANPAGQILSLVMMLRESFGMEHLAASIERAVEGALSAGWRTRDVAAPGCRIVGTREMTERIVQALEEQAAPQVLKA